MEASASCVITLIFEVRIVEMTEEKPLLSVYIHARLITKYGSLANGSQMLGVNYETLKKSIQRNSFGRQLLSVITPELTPTQLLTHYTFRLSRTRHDPSGCLPVKPSICSRLELFGFELDEISFVQHNKFVQDRIRQLVKGECARLREVLECGGS